MSNVIKLSSPATRQFWEIPVLFEDQHLLALDKPGGLLVSPDRLDPKRPNLMGLLHGAIKLAKPWTVARGLGYLANTHRMDFEASGVLVLAKTKLALVQVVNQFSSGRAIRTWTAIVTGAPAAERFAIDTPVGPHPLQPGRMRVDSRNGMKARTEFAVAERFSGHALLRCRVLTERTHQVRVHLQRAGFPIVSDPLYNGKPLLLSRLKRGDYRLKPGQDERPLLTRVALHASELQLPHPVTGAALTIQAPLPREFQVALKYLRRYAGGGGSPSSEAEEPLR